MTEKKKLKNTIGTARLKVQNKLYIYSIQKYPQNELCILEIAFNILQSSKVCTVEHLKKTDVI